MSRYKDWYDETLTREADAISGLKRTLDYETLDRIVELLLTVKQDRRRVITAGCGTSGTAARRIAHILSCIEVPAMFLSPADAPHGAMGLIQHGDIVVLIAKGGNTAEILNFIPCCREKGATIIGVTHNKDSALAKNCDILMLMDTGEEPGLWRMMPCASTLGVVAAWDAISLAVMRLNGFTKEQFLLIHPGGATGETLKSSLRGK
ncbi:MAG: SIS domain-containing protein [Christensenellaceae bacterium]|jgi:D-arabinose 5-phosphate isomerase GutQ|nr:SIS domain-containing protein [Christensenellaceae bacterium]